jgi:hypothetical protein
MMMMLLLGSSVVAFLMCLQEVDDEETTDEINSQAMNYEYLRGATFSNKMAKDNLQTMAHHKCYWLLLFRFNSSK